MNRRISAILIIAVGLMILIGLVWFLFLAPVPEPAPEPVEPVANEQTGTPATLPQSPTPAPAPTPPPPGTGTTQNSERAIQRLAANVLERYGTYSNQSGYENLKDLQVFMSRSFRERSQQTLERAQSTASDTSLYYGITTKAVVTTTRTFNRETGRGVFDIQAQRREAVGNPDNVRAFQQNATVTMVREGGVWKVDTIEWEE